MSKSQFQIEYKEYVKYKKWQEILGCRNAEEVIDFVMSNYLTESEKCRAIANQIQQIADLQHQLEVTEKALDLACDYLVSNDDKDDELYKLVENIYDDNEYLETKINYFKEQAESEMEGE